VIGTQWGGKPKIKNCGRIFVSISAIDVSAFPLITSRELHIRSTKNVKREGTVEERFDNLDFGTLGVNRQSCTSSQLLK
jgi:hypothetical protein